MQDPWRDTGVGNNVTFESVDELTSGAGGLCDDLSSALAESCVTTDCFREVSYALEELRF